MANPQISIVIPAKNESGGLATLLPKLTELYPEAEIIVVDDGSTDNTVEVCRRFGIEPLSNPYSLGNGASIKAGARAATGEYLVLMDGDGQHSPTDIARLVEKLDQGYDMVVGARDKKSQASFARSLGNRFYSKFASWIVNHTVEDLTSGFRAVRRENFIEFLYLLPNGFSYPTTITMSFFRTGYPVAYVPIRAAARIGRSHIHLLRDGVRFLLVIFRIGTLFSPLKVFLPSALSVFATGVWYYVYTYIAAGRFTNMGVLLISLSMLIFLIGLISEQITMLIYQRSGGRRLRKPTQWSQGG
jgi:glycosyltransferase involved in cell wall biosynthesis